MTWVRLDDRSTFHPKVVQAGNRAWGAFLRAVAWSALHNTDGRVPANVLRSIESSRATWDELARARLVDELDLSRDGFAKLHDFKDYALSRFGTADERTEKARKAAETRWAKHGGEHATEHATEHADKHTDPDAQPMPRARDPVPSRPVHGEIPSVGLPFQDSDAPATPAGKPPAPTKPKKPRRAPPGTKAPPSDEDPGPWLVRWKIPPMSDPVDGAEVENFIDYHRQRGLPSDDWSASWRTWKRKQKIFAAERAARLGVRANVDESTGYIPKNPPPDSLRPADWPVYPKDLERPGE